MPLDHICINVGPAEHAAVKDWYEASLKPVGYTKLRTEGENEESAGFSCNGLNCEWWVIAAKEPPNLPMHFAFQVQDRSQVDQFHGIAVSAGGRCNGPPGLRPQYSSNYYAAFVLDPIGNNVEVLCLKEYPNTTKI